MYKFGNATRYKKRGSDDMEKILEEINSKLEILISKKDDFELLTAEQIAEETGIPINNVRKLFNDKSLAVQTYTKPRLVTRKA